MRSSCSWFLWKSSSSILQVLQPPFQALQSRKTAATITRNPSLPHEGGCSVSALGFHQLQTQDDPIISKDTEPRRQDKQREGRHCSCCREQPGEEIWGPAACTSAVEKGNGLKFPKLKPFFKTNFLSLILIERPGGWARSTRRPHAQPSSETECLHLKGCLEEELGLCLSPGCDLICTMLYKDLFFFLEYLQNTLKT